MEKYVSAVINGRTFLDFHTLATKSFILWLEVTKLEILSFLGTKGRTKPKLLDKFFHIDFFKGQEDTYVIEAEDVGEPVMIKLENDQGGMFHRSSDWFVDKVLIRSSNSRVTVYEFPCYAWVKRESVFFEGRGRKIC